MAPAAAEKEDLQLQEYLRNLSGNTKGAGNAGLGRGGGAVQPASKTQAGPGDKSKAGWRILRPDDSGINWDEDWHCCGMVILAKKKRCGKVSHNFI